MKSNLIKQLEPMGVGVKGFMLLKIDLPNTFESAIVRTEVTKQEETTYLIERSISKTKQETQNIRIKGEASIMVINANATSVATQRLNEGAGEVARQNIDLTAIALKKVQSKLNFKNPAKSLMDYHYY
jgi:regulator of protease activity HflC (stomatin/prohibitin superfamily)